MMDISSALKGLANWRPKPPVDSPPTPSEHSAPPAPDPCPPMREDPAYAGALDDLVGTAAKAAVADGGPPSPAALPPVTGSFQNLEDLRQDLAVACAEAGKSSGLPPEVLALRAESEKFRYPEAFFEQELLPLLMPPHPGLIYKVLRIEPSRVLLVAPDGAEISLYHPEHNPGLGG